MQSPKTNKPETERFSQLRSLRDIAAYLSIAPKKLSYILYVMPPESKYHSFTIAKKSGRARTIMAPCLGLKLIQQRLNSSLQKIFWENYSKRRHYVFGFLEGQNIADNARRHIGKKYVINVDLKDFFDQITFPRIRGMFLKYPFNLTTKAATVLAQIVTHQFKLPQGAPTSPVISNFICARMDGELCKLARSHHYNYSRYADDITFSCGSIIPESLGSLNEGIFSLSPCIAEIINTHNKFVVNEQKTRCMGRFMRQEVTGLTVNNKINVPRRYIKQIRAMLHDWELYGEEVALSNHLSRWRKKHNNPDKPICSFSNIVKGKIEYLRQIRGADDLIYRNFLFQYDQLTLADWPVIASKNVKIMSQGIFIIEDGIALSRDCDETKRLPKKAAPELQGTGFLLKDWGLITNAHILDESRQADQNQIAKDIDVYRHIGEAREKRSYPVTIQYINRKCDIAILNIRGLCPRSCFDFSIQEPATNQMVLIAGYPNYSNEPLSILSAKISGSKRHCGIDYYLIDKRIFTGNSGGPVFDDRLRVIGVATKGESESSEMNAFIPINFFIPLREDDKNLAYVCNAPSNHKNRRCLCVKGQEVWCEVKKILQPLTMLIVKFLTKRKMK